MKFNIPYKFKAKILDGKADFELPMKGILCGEAVKKINKITIANRIDETVVDCFSGDLFVGSYTVPEVNFQNGNTLTIEGLDIRLHFTLE